MGRQLGAAEAAHCTRAVRAAAPRVTGYLREAGEKKGRSDRPLGENRAFALARGSTVVVGTGGRGHLGDDLAIDDRQAVAGLVVHADGVFGAVVAVRHVITDRLRL